MAFEYIPNDWRDPLITFEIKPGLGNVGPSQKVVLVFAPMIDAGTYAGDGQADTLYDIFEIADGTARFGQGSIAALMLAAVFAAYPTARVKAMGIADNGAATKATRDITITVTTAESGTLHFLIGGRYYRIGVTAGDSQTAIASAIQAELDADVDAPFVATVLSNVVSLEAKNGGTLGDESIKAYHNFRGAAGGQTTPGGVSVVIGAITSGTTDPVLTTPIAELGDQPFETIVQPWAADTELDAWETEMARRWNPLVQYYGQPVYGHMWTALSGTVGTLSAHGNDRNDPHATICGLYDSPTPSYIWAAAWAGLGARVLANNPARPLQRMTIPGVISPPEASRFTATQRNALNFDGISTFMSDLAGNAIVARTLTTYQRNAAGSESIAFLDVTTPYTLAELHRLWIADLGEAFPNHILADDDEPVDATEPIATIRSIASVIVARYAQQAKKGWVQDVEGFKSTLLVQRDRRDDNPTGDANRVNMYPKPNLGNQLRVLAGESAFTV